MAITTAIKAALAGALNNMANSSTANTQQAALQQQSAHSHTITSAGAHTHPGTTIGGGYTTTTGQQNTFIGHSAGIAHSISGGNVFVGNSFQPLTAEEAKELLTLEEEYKRELKVSKISYFKNLPVETRQYIVNTILWQREAERIKKIEEEVEAKMPDRFKELKSRQINLNSWYQSGVGINSIYNGHIGAIMPFLGGLSQEEIISAHSDACAEEALTSS